MRPNARQTERMQQLLQDAALFGLLAQGFCYPDPRQHAATRERFSEIWAARDRPSRTSALGRLLKTARRSWETADAANLQAEYGRLFLGDAPCPLHETAYGDGRRIAGRSVELADIQGFYAAFGVDLAESNPDLPDHLCTELEFYSLLLVKQAYALNCNWPLRYRLSRRAATAFLEQHLGRWVGALVCNLAEHRAAAPYLGLAKLLDAVVKRRCRRLRVSPPLLEARLSYDAMQAESFDCPNRVPARPE